MIIGARYDSLAGSPAWPTAAAAWHGRPPGPTHCGLWQVPLLVQSLLPRPPLDQRAVP